MELRDYQKETIYHLMHSELAKECVCLPTGSGKTFVFSTFSALQAKEGKRILILVNRKELLDQTFQAIKNRYGYLPCLITSKSKNFSENNIYIGMVETVYRRKKVLEELRKSIDICIVDECHILQFIKVVEGFKRIVGFSATPLITKKDQSLANYYHNLYTPLQVSELIENKYLCPPELYSPPQTLEIDRSKIKKMAGEYDEKSMTALLSQDSFTKAVVKYAHKYCKNKRAIIYNASIDHSELITNLLRNEGFEAYHVDGTTPENERQYILERLKEKPCIISNVGVLTFGFDCPEVEVVFLNRLTKSLSLYLQMCGRGARTSTKIDKKLFYILDICGNWAEHGRWQDDRDWETLFHQSKKGEGDGLAPLKLCPQCDTVVAAQAKKCFKCGYEFKAKESRKEEKEIELINIDTAVLKLDGIMDAVNTKGQNIYRGLHLLKEQVYKANKKADLISLQQGLLSLLPEWCKSTGKRNNQWNKDFCCKIMEEYVNEKRGQVC
ncbi:MAG TPA: DEAD/DEAH box helicase family protein [Vampirovibrionales bacterium]